MVKADLTRDYYGDLDLQPGADAADIKKQFKKLALTYHPDRNPGRENEVTAKFQLIQSAHEVLTDPTERAKYDANRVRTTYKTYSGGTASGVRGNPWSGAGAQWAPPPKPPPTARSTRNRPAPAPSAGARRYEKFDASKTSSQSSHSAYEGPEARRSNYDAWENMKPHHSPKTSQSRTAPKPPPRENPRPSKDFRRPAPVPPPRGGFDEYRDQTPDTSPHRRSASTNTSARRGFMPNTPGGDEPAAPRGAYFTTRAAPPEPPPRNPPSQETPSNVGADPLQHFRDGEDGDKVPNLEKRYTPYATHGGEKLNPFESANLNNLNRSKSTRTPTGKSASKTVPRTGSDPDLFSPRRQRTKSHPVTIEIDSDSSDDTSGGPTNGAAFGKSRASTRRSNGVPPRPQPASDANEASPKTRKPKSKISQFQQWMKENPDSEPPVNSWVPDGPPLRSHQPENQTDTDKMYGKFEFPFCGGESTSNYPVNTPKVSEKISSRDPRVAPRRTLFDLKPDKLPNLFAPKAAQPATPPSGIAREAQRLNAFEGLQHSIVDRLINNKTNGCTPPPKSSGTTRIKLTTQNGKHPINGNLNGQPDQWRDYRDPSEAGSPAKKSKSFITVTSVPLRQSSKARDFGGSFDGMNKNANRSTKPSSFTFPVDDDTFKPTKPTPNGFTSNSAENISTNFNAEAWKGTFEAGADFFKPDPKAPGGPTRGRAQSASRSRGRSPIKVSTVPRFPQPEERETMESPGGTRYPKFTQEQWKDQFKDPTPGFFAPPPPDLSTRPTPRKQRKPTMGGKAAVIDDSETPDEKPLFDAKPPGSSTPNSTASPDAMDVDTPPVSNPNTVPKFTEKLNVNTENLKRPAGPSQSQSPTEIDTEALKVDFNDLKVADIISALTLPVPPTPPSVPKQLLPEKFERPNWPAFDIYKKQFGKYMGEWDLFNTKYMLHLVARKSQVEALGARRWEDEDGAEFYRRGLREDDVVLEHWRRERGVHEKVVKEFVVVRERVRTREETFVAANTPGAASSSERPRKKTH